MSIQLTLPIQLRDGSTFANFYSAKNKKLLAFLQNESEKFLYLWGHPGAGCTHLLQACCQFKNERAIYLSCSELIHLTPAIFENLENANLVCLDDLQCVAGNNKWEEAIFNLFNRIQFTENRLLVAAKTGPEKLNLLLPDLQSRLAGGLIFQVQSLENEDKLPALQLRAKIRGLELSKEVGEFLLNRMPRNFSDLFAVLEKLDAASLAAQRKLTIPFVKSVLEI